MKDKILLFIDGSVDNQLKVGCGAYIVVDENQNYNDTTELPVKIKEFKDTSSTKLELQTLLWALNELPDKTKQVIVYTDSQNIIRLPSRRISLEENNYKSKKNKLLSNHDLYRRFYKIMDEIDCEFLKVKGHKPIKDKDNIDKLFTLVDRAARKGLRNLNN